MTMTGSSRSNLCGPSLRAAARFPYQDSIDNNMALSQEYRDLQGAVYGYNDEINQAERIIKNLNTAMEKDAEAVADAKQEMELANEAIEQMAAAGTANTDVTAETAAQMQELQSTVTGVREEINTLVAAYTEAYDAALDSISGQYELWDEATEVVATSAGSINSALESQVTYWQDYNANLQALTDRVGDIEGLSEMIASFADGSEDSVNAIAGMAGATDEQLEAMVSNWRDLKAEQEEAAGSVADLKTDFTATMDELQSELAADIEAMDLGTEAAESGKATIQGFVSGAEGMLPQVQAAYVSAQYIKEVVGGQAEENSEASATTGLAIQAVFVRENWNNDGKDTVLDCGQFELDSIKASGPPATITIKATSLPFNAQIRQTEKTKAWEAYTLSGIAQEMAGANGMACLYESASDPYYERVEQYKVSDIKFLSQLCHDAGISLKATNNILVLFDQADYEAKDPTFTVKRGSGSYTKYDLSVGTADTKYTSCRVRYADPATGQVIEGTAYAEDYKADSKNNQQLEVTAKVASIAEAQTLAAKQLRLHNKYSRTATFTFPGDPSKVAGVTATLEGWGAWDGKYIIKQSKHSLGSSGYTTQTVLRRILEGY